MLAFVHNWEHIVEVLNFGYPQYELLFALTDHNTVMTDGLAIGEHEEVSEPQEPLVFDTEFVGCSQYSLKVSVYNFELLLQGAMEAFGHCLLQIVDLRLAGYCTSLLSIIGEPGSCSSYI